MADLIATIKNGEDEIGGYYRIDDEDSEHDYEIKIQATDKIHGQLREDEKAIELDVANFFEVMGFSDSDLDLEINKVE